jgi:hypothetical protein
MSVELWNQFHDGDIAQIIVPRPDQRVVTIGISYLRDMFDSPGDAFRVTLSGCDQFAYQLYDSDDWISDAAQIMQHSPEILSAQEGEGEMIVISCTNGTLRMRYKEAIVMLDTGQPVTLEALRDASARYWKQWR